MSDKVKVLVRNPYDYSRETKTDIHKVARNYDMSLHPFSQEREYVKALNASKTERMVSKPFIRSLDGAVDDVEVMSVDPKKISLAAFGTANGKVQYWNISSNIKLADFQAHQSCITGLSHFDEATFLTCGYDKVVNYWDFNNQCDYDPWKSNVKPLNSFPIADVPQCLSTQIFDQHFAIGTSQCVLIYKLNLSESEAYTSFCQKAKESVHHVKFHPTENDLLCCLTGDNKINICDMRQSEISAQIKMSHRSNSMCFNPQFPMYFTTASADYNLYTFDIRYFKMPIKIHNGHVQSVTDVCYSNRGFEFVTCSVDETIRIFDKDNSKSREIYTDKRMFRGISVKYTYEDRYILSSSGDHNVRLWKSHAAEKLGAKTPREKISLLEAQKLREKYSKNPIVSKIQNRRTIPHSIKSLTSEHRIMHQKELRKERNIIANSKPGTVKRQKKYARCLADK